MFGSMAEAPWLTIIGVGEDGPAGLSPASLAALEAAEIVMGPPRHMALLPGTGTRVAWPVPFADGLPMLLGFRGRATVVLASGDPFWFGGGTTIARHLEPDEWVAHPGPSTFSLVANRMGWALESVLTFGLHAAPLSRLRPVLAPGQRLIVLVRDGAAVQDLAAYLGEAGFGASTLHVMEAVGGPRERVTQVTAERLKGTFAHPVCVAVQVEGAGDVLSLASGRPDDWFAHDGQITKRPIRALTLSALAPRPGEHLWDIGGGSGSIAIEWLLSHPSLSATSLEPNQGRAARIRDNAARLGVDHLDVIEGAAPETFPETKPNAVFIGGGLSADLLDALQDRLSSGTRIVANAVTLDSEALLIETASKLGGDLMRIDIAQPTPIGPRKGWNAAYPIVQWSHTL